MHQHSERFRTATALLLSERPDIIPLAVRGHVETRINRLIEGRVDALILAEVGIKRLNSISALDAVKETSLLFVWIKTIGLPHLDGAVCIHCKAERSMNSSTADVLNHPQTEQDIVKKGPFSIE